MCGAYLCSQLRFQGYGEHRGDIICSSVTGVGSLLTRTPFNVLMPSLVACRNIVQNLHKQCVERANGLCHYAEVRPPLLFCTRCYPQGVRFLREIYTRRTASHGSQNHPSLPAGKVAVVELLLRISYCCCREGGQRTSNPVLRILGRAPTVAARAIEIHDGSGNGSTWNTDE